MYDSPWEDGSATEGEVEMERMHPAQPHDSHGYDASGLGALPADELTEAEEEAHHQHEEEEEDHYAHAQQQQSHPPPSSFRSSSPRGSHTRSDSLSGSSSSPTDSALLGRSSVVANKLLVEMFESFSDNFHVSHPFHLKRIFFRALLANLPSLTFLLVLAMVWVSFAFLRRTHMLVECCILSVNWILNAWLETYMAYLTHTEMLRLLRARMELVLDLPPLAETRTTEMPPSASFVRTLRDGVWRPLPMNLLVKGDIIELDADEDVLPCPAKRVFLHGQQPGAGTGAAVGAASQPTVHAPPIIAPSFTLSHADHAAHTHVLRHQPSLTNLQAYDAAGAAPLHNRDRGWSTLSAIESNSAAEVESKMGEAVPPQRTETQTAETGIELAALPRNNGAQLFPPASQHATSSVASSYSATPSPASSSLSGASMPVPPLDVNPPSQSLPPPPPPAPPAIPAPASPDIMSERSSLPLTSSDSDQLQIAVGAATGSEMPAAAPHFAHVDVPSTPIAAARQDHLAVPRNQNVVSPLSSADSQLSMSSFDTDVKEQIHQTEATFVPPSVLQPRQQLPVAPPTFAAQMGGAGAAAAGMHSEAVPPSAAGQTGSHDSLPLQGILPTLADEGPQHYIVEESPLKPQLEFILQPRSPVHSPADASVPSSLRQSFLPPTNTFLTRFNFILSKQKFIQLGVLLLYWFFVLLRLGLDNGRGFTDDVDASGDRTYEYLYWLLYCSSLLVLPLLNLSNSFWLFVLDALGNSILLATQEEMQSIYDDELNKDSSAPKKSTASLFSSASRKRAMKKRMAEQAKAKARAAALKKKKRRRRRRGGSDSSDDESDESSVSSVSSVSVSSSDSDSSLSSRGSDDDELDEDAQTYAIVDSLSLPLSSIARHGWDIMTGREFYVTRNVNPLQVLGGVTVFCCLDNEGILSENEPSADHICFLTQPPAAPHTSHSHSHRAHTHRHGPNGMAKVIVLDLMNDPDSANGIVIEGEDWPKYINSLKPLGINAVLNNPCNLPQAMLSSYEFSSTEPTTLTTTSSSQGGSASGGSTTLTTTNSADSSDSDANSGLGCLCMLGKEIGFDVRFIRQQFYIGKAIYTVAVQNTTTKIRPKRKHRLVAPKPSAAATPATAASATGPAQPQAAPSPDLQIQSRIHTMTSLSVQDRFQPSSLHLMTNGDPFLVLFHSSHYWTGSSIQPLTEQVRTQMLGIYQQWKHKDLKVLAFSYAPIFPPSIFNYVAMFNPDKKVEYVIENLNEELEARRRAEMANMQAQGIQPSLSKASSSSSISTMGDAHEANHSNYNNTEPPQFSSLRRRYASEHSTIAEQDEDEHGHAHAHYQSEEHHAHDSALTHPHDEFVEHDHTHPHTLGPNNLSFSLAPSSHPPTSLANSQLHRTLSDEFDHELDPDDTEYSRSRSRTRSYSYQRGHHHDHEHGDHQDHQGYDGQPPPPPPSPPHIPAPAEQERKEENKEEDHAPTTAASAAAHVPAEQPSTSSSASSSRPPSAAKSVSFMPVPVSAVHGNSESAGHTRYSLEPYANQPPQTAASDLDIGTSQPSAHANLVKSQSFPSIFQPHLSLASVLPGTDPQTLLQDSNRAAPPLRGDSMPVPKASPQLSTQSNATASGSGGEHTCEHGHPTHTFAPPPPSSLVSLPTESDLLKSLHSNQIFLGMIAMRDQPKIEVRALVEDMKNAGIRFVLFSPDNERKTQAFGAKIGLFTDFNFFVSLKDPVRNEETGAGGKYDRYIQGKSQLPCGISSIRPHLQTVDNVPLLVSLFTDCEPSSVCEMIRIYQENGESVFCIGSSLKVENTQAFMQADISACMDPMPSKDCPYKTYKDRQQNNAWGNKYPQSTYQRILQQIHHANTPGSGSNGSRAGSPNSGEEEQSSGSGFNYSEAREFAVSSAITSMPCALLLSATTDLHHFMALICEGRRLLHCMTQALAFAAAAYLMLAFVLLVDFIVDAPTILTGYQLLWLIWIIIPLLSLSLLNTPREVDLMRQLPQKNAVRGEGLYTIGGVGMMEGEAEQAGEDPWSSPEEDWNEEEDMEAGGGGVRDQRSNTMAGVPRPARRAIRPPPIVPEAGRYLVYFLLRFLLSGLVYLVFFLWLLHESFEPRDELRDNYYWSTTFPRSLFNNHSYDSTLLAVQNYSLVVFVAMLAVHSMGFVYRYDSLKQSSPFDNRVWTGAALLSIVLQALFCLVSVFAVGVPAVDVTNFRWYVFFAWPIFIILMDELCKAHDRARRDFLHKKARQHFDTVLGMHSPK